MSPKPKTKGTNSQAQKTHKPKNHPKARVPRTDTYDPEAIKHKGGRPPVWTPEARAKAQAEMLTRMSGGEYITDMTDEMHLPSIQTVWIWTETDPKFAELYVRAQDRGYEARFNRLTKIASSRENDVVVVEMPNGQFKAVANTVAVQRDRLIVDTEKTVLAMARPKRYGQKLQHVGGDETDAPIKIEAEVKPDRELAKAIASILARSQGSKDDG